MQRTGASLLSALPRLAARRAFSSTPSALDRANAQAKVDTATQKAEKTFGRFWKTVNLKESPEGYQILLDTRPLKTPGGKPLHVPAQKKALAYLIASEWDNQKQVLKGHALPMTSLASRAIDALSDSPSLPSAPASAAPKEKNRAEVCEALLKYLDTDTICFHEEQPWRLVKMQEERWLPIIDWVKEEYKCDVRIFDGLFAKGHPAETREKLASIIAEYSPFKLAAFERAVYTTKSFLIAFALIEGRLTVEEAALASQVEVDSQIDLWGEVEDTHDVDKQDVRRQLGSVRCLLLDSKLA